MYCLVIYSEDTGDTYADTIPSGRDPFAYAKESARDFADSCACDEGETIRYGVAAGKDPGAARLDHYETDWYGSFVVGLDVPDDSFSFMTIDDSETIYHDH
jgi:hypothetical protein